MDEKTIAYADFRGNRQYISTGNLKGDGRVSLILMDYPNQRNGSRSGAGQSWSSIA